MPVIANQELHLEVMKAAETYVAAVEALIEVAFAGNPEGARRATTASSAVSMVLDRLGARYGALAAWAGAGQGIGMTFAQMDDLNRNATRILLEESIVLGFDSTVAAFTPAPGRPS